MSWKLWILFGILVWGWINYFFHKNNVPNTPYKWVALIFLSLMGPFSLIVALYEAIVSCVFEDYKLYFGLRFR